MGGPLPIGRQPITAFGAAASLIHPATGYSLARSLREAPGLAKEVSEILQQDLSIRETAQNVWNALWPPRKRRQVFLSSALSLTQAPMSATSAVHHMACHEVNVIRTLKSSGAPKAVYMSTWISRRSQAALKRLG